MHRVSVPLAMRRSTDQLIALQFLSVIVVVTLLLLAVLLMGARRASGLDHVRSWRGYAAPAHAGQLHLVSAGNPLHYLTRLLHAGISAGKHGRGAALALEPPVQSEENSRGQ